MKITIFTKSIALLLFIFALCCFASAQSASSFSKQGDKLFEQEKYAEAIDAYKKAVAIKPDAVDFFNIGVAYHSLKQYEEAIIYLNKAAQIKPNDAETWHAIGAAYYNLKQFDKATDAYRKSLKLDSKSAETQKDLSDAENQLKNGGAINQSSDSSGSAQTSQAALLINQGLELFNAKNYQKAIKIWEQAALVDPSNPSVFYNLGAGYYTIGKFTKAAANYREAVRLKPDYAEAREWAAQSEQKIKEEKAAQDAAWAGLSSAGKTNDSNIEPQGEQLAAYKVGDEVEVSEAGRWVAGTVTKVEGEGRLVRVTVKYVFNGSAYNEDRNYNGVRHAAQSAASRQAAQTSSNAIDFGEYVCEQGLRATGYTPKGYFVLKADGTYTYPAQGSSGKFRYDAGSGEITWLSGYFANGGNSTTKFTPGKRVSQIDITYHTKSGELYWSCGHNK